MAHERQININIRTTKYGWNHIIQLIKEDNNPAWAEFNAGLIKVIEDVVKRETSISLNSSSQAQSHDNNDNTPESQGHHIGEDGRYHDDEYFAENYGSYSNYRRLSEEASDMGFPDADTYQNWLND